MKKNKAKIIRILVLVGILAFVTYEGYLHQVLGGGKAPSVHALCPLGGLESLYALLFTGGFIQKIYSGTLILFVLTMVLVVLFRRSFCGLLCPFGALQELFGKLGKKIFKRTFVIPASIDRPFRYFKYLILLITVGMAWYAGSLWISPFDPYVAYSHITVINESIAENPVALIGFILLGITLIGSLLVDRFFCKYLCPMGALYGILGKLSITKIVRNEEKCIHCNKCSKACCVNLQVDQMKKVTSAECINCNECVEACPVKGALEIKTAGKKVHSLAILSAVVVLFFGTIVGAQLTGFYQLTPTGVEKGETISISEVKGYFTIEEAATATGIKLTDFYTRMGIPTSVDKNTQMKKIGEQVPGFELDAAKEKASQ